MKTNVGFVGAALLAAPFVLAAQTPTPTPKSAPATGVYATGKRFTGVQLQQGRIQTDADWNEQVQACRRQNEALKKQLKSRANELEIQLRQVQAVAEKADESKKNAQEHNKAIKDAIRKMLDQVAEMNRATNL
jgi:hypothetical protein